MGRGRERKRAGERGPGQAFVARPLPHHGPTASAEQMTDQKNTILAIVLSALVLIGWQLYFGLPQVEKQKQLQQQQAQERVQPAPGAPAPQAAAPNQPVPGAAPQAPGRPAGVPALALTRE